MYIDESCPIAKEARVVCTAWLREGPSQSIAAYLPQSPFALCSPCRPPLTLPHLASQAVRECDQGAAGISISDFAALLKTTCAGFGTAWTMEHDVLGQGMHTPCGVLLRAQRGPCLLLLVMACCWAWCGAEGMACCWAWCGAEGMACC